MNILDNPNQVISLLGCVWVSEHLKHSCVHDSHGVRRRMIEHVRKAEQEMGKYAPINYNQGVLGILAASTSAMSFD